MIDLDKLEALEKAAPPLPWERGMRLTNEVWAFTDAVMGAYPEMVAELRAARAVVEYVGSIADLDGCEELRRYKYSTGERSLL